MNHPTKEQIDAFVASIRGDVVRPGDDNYDDARAIYNGMIDKKPSMIIQVSNVADVISAVKFCAANKVSVAVRSGGHNGKTLWISCVFFRPKISSLLCNVNFLNRFFLLWRTSSFSLFHKALAYPQLMGVSLLICGS